MMKRVFVLISLVVAILVIGGNAFAQDKTSKTSIPEPSLSSEWKFMGRNSHNGTTLYFNTRKITYLQKGIVEVWELMVPREEDRGVLVNDFKKILLFKGKDPNNAERFWYLISLYKVNCKTHQNALLEDIAYSFGKAVLDDVSFQHEEWDYIIPGSADEAIENYVCK